MHKQAHVEQSLVVAQRECRPGLAEEHAVVVVDESALAQSRREFAHQSGLGGDGGVSERHHDAHAAHTRLVVERCRQAIGCRARQGAVEGILDEHGSLWHHQRLLAHIVQRVAVEHAVHVHERGGRRGSRGTLRRHHREQGGSHHVGIDDATRGKRAVHAAMHMHKARLAHVLALAVHQMAHAVVEHDIAVGAQVDEARVGGRNERAIRLVHEAHLVLLDHDVVASGRAAIVLIARRVHRLMVVARIGHLLAMPIEAHDGVALEHGEHAIGEKGLQQLVLRAGGSKLHLAALVDDGKVDRRVALGHRVDHDGQVAIAELVHAGIFRGHHGVAMLVDVAPLPVQVLIGRTAVVEHRALRHFGGEGLHHAALRVDDLERPSAMARHRQTVVAEHRHAAIRLRIDGLRRI